MIGLDLCCQQGSITWSKVKAAGIEFIIPRAGWGINCDEEQIEPRYLYNVSEALANGISVPGVYHFVYATSVLEARQNAQNAIEHVQKAGLPKSTVIWCDIEYDTITQAENRGVKLTNADLREFAEAFCDYCLSEGYPTGIYLNADFLLYRYGKDIMYKYDIWFADPSGAFNYDCVYKQVDWSAQIPGIPRAVDQDRWVGTYTAGTAKPKAQEDTKVTLIDKFCSALDTLGDGRYYYYGEGNPGIGCSDYVKLALQAAGIIHDGETFWAGQAQRGVLEDKSRFQNIPWDPRSLKRGDILWSQGHHVAVWDGGSGVWEGSPVHSHGVCDNGKTGVGRRSHHTYWNCGTGANTWSNIYRIIDSGDVKDDAQEVVKVDKGFAAETMAKYLPVIKTGVKGDMVRALQTIMRKYGWYNDTIDGSCGPNTVAGIKLMQTSLGVDVDGSFGPKSWAALLR